MNKRICKKCKLEKEIIEFAKEKRTKLGLRSWCRKCNNKDCNDLTTQLVELLDKEVRKLEAACPDEWDEWKDGFGDAISQILKSLDL